MDQRNNGRFAPGNKLGKGRKVGSRNKTTSKIRDTFLNFVEANLDRLQADFDTLDPKDRFKYLFEMTKFILPSLKSIEFGNILDELTEKEFEQLITKLKNEYSQN